MDLTSLFAGIAIGAIIMTVVYSIAAQRDAIKQIEQEAHLKAYYEKRYNDLDKQYVKAMIKVFKQEGELEDLRKKENIT